VEDYELNHRSHLKHELSTYLRGLDDGFDIIQEKVGLVMSLLPPGKFLRMNKPLLDRVDELRNKWAVRLQGRHPTSTEGLETWVEDLRWVFYQREWMEEGLKLAAADQEETARWLESLEVPMTPEMFYERFPEAKPKMMSPPAERREARRQCHLAELAGRNPIPDCRAELIKKYGHIFGITAGQAGPASGNGGP
jgi:hypothetical protein